MMLVGDQSGIIPSSTMLRPGIDTLKMMPGKPKMK
jgi:hypothetical protein